MNAKPQAASAPDAQFDRPLTVRVGEACRLTGISRSKLYEFIKAGEIETFKVGNMTLIPMDGLTAFLDKRRNGRANL